MLFKNGLPQRFKEIQSSMQTPRRDDQNLTSSFENGPTSTSKPTETNQPTINEYNPSPQKLKDHKDGRSQRWQTT
jgi:hypothetical protein